ncbi:hypothetical protein L1887_27747 [Cichorium endivia]|nr:hypothetical protein L1887_27747 [Cichorium endivia]
MKNHKLSWVLSFNLRLQSENEVICCTANFIYATHLSSSHDQIKQPPEKKVNSVGSNPLSPSTSKCFAGGHSLLLCLFPALHSPSQGGVWWFKLRPHRLPMAPENAAPPFVPTKAIQP